jgi:molybdopterin-guanine dinucleotide biosynthesis protein
MLEILAPCARPLVIEPSHRPFVILVVGVNGSGKTTTIGKLARRFKQQGLDVMLAAGDTFRAAAIEQLQVWGKRNEVPVIAQQSGADPAAVIFDALQAARARDCDVLIADTAGRLHSQVHLMEELKKIKRVIARFDPTAPHEVLLVLDAGLGQNRWHRRRSSTTRSASRESRSPSSIARRKAGRCLRSASAAGFPSVTSVSASRPLTSASSTPRPSLMPCSAVRVPRDRFRARIQALSERP